MEKQPCPFYLENKCMFGARCKHSHTNPVPTGVQQRSLTRGEKTVAVSIPAMYHREEQELNASFKDLIARVVSPAKQHLFENLLSSPRRHRCRASPLVDKFDLFIAIVNDERWSCLRGHDDRRMRERITDIVLAPKLAKRLETIELKGKVLRDFAEIRGAVQRAWEETCQASDSRILPVSDWDLEIVLCLGKLLDGKSDSVKLDKAHDCGNIKRINDIIGSPWKIEEQDFTFEVKRKEV